MSLISNEQSLFVNIGRGAIRYQLHPLVVLSILDHFKRREEGDTRVVGTLIGEYSSANTVVIKNCFPVPHNEANGDIGIDMEYHHNMVDLYKQVNANEVVVGWYSTGTEITDDSSFLHSAYCRECKDPVHVLIDTSLTNWQMGVQAFISQDIQVGSKKVVSRFEKVKLTLNADEAEKIGVDAIMYGTPEDVNRLDAPVTLVSDMENLFSALLDLLSRVESIKEWVDTVRKGEVQINDKVLEIGQLITEALAVIPQMETQTFEKIFNDNVQDLLMVVYLSNITKTQIALTRKLQKTLV